MYRRKGGGAAAHVIAARAPGQCSGMTPTYHGGVRHRKVQRKVAVVRAFGLTTAVALVVGAPALAFSNDVRTLVGRPITRIPRGLDIVDQSEQRALWNLCALLERELASRSAAANLPLTAIAQAGHWESQ
jgi:hypothetical protein